MSVKDAIRAKLEAAFKPTYLEIFDESHKHAGHVGNPHGVGETHIGITIVSEFFAGKSRIERARLVHSAISEEMKKIHALAPLKTITPEEYIK